MKFLFKPTPIFLVRLTKNGGLEIKAGDVSHAVYVILTSGVFHANIGIQILDR